MAISDSYFTYADTTEVKINLWKAVEISQFLLWQSYAGLASKINLFVKFQIYANK